MDLDPPTPATTEAATKLKPYDWQLEIAEALTE
ncbi:hypothetical protein RSAG8_07819, partial [Rhizoctonia solani AG-8 WAC10335]